METKAEAKPKMGNGDRFYSSGTRMICVKTPHGACIFCGKDVPEGMDICPICLKKYGGESK